jgi:hypothetical protein
MPAIEQKQHGGKREGSGRKPLHDSAKVHVWCRLSQDVIDWLGKQDESSGEIIDAAVRRCQAFRRGKAYKAALGARPVNTGFRVTVDVAGWLKTHGPGPIIETILRSKIDGG